MPWDAVQMYSVYSDYVVYSDRMYRDSKIYGACTVIIGNRISVPLQKAFCEALVGLDAVWALSNPPFMFSTLYLDVSVDAG